MASKTFTLNTEPHRALIGDVTYLFQPEVAGAEFADILDDLNEVQSKLKNAEGRKATSGKPAKESRVDSALLKELNAALNRFAVAFMLPESREEWARHVYPDRILVQLMEWVSELYGGGSGNPDAAGGTSTP